MLPIALLFDEHFRTPSALPSFASYDLAEVPSATPDCVAVLLSLPISLIAAYLALLLSSNSRPKQRKLADQFLFTIAQASLLHIKVMLGRITRGSLPVSDIPCLSQSQCIQDPRESGTY